MTTHIKHNCELCLREYKAGDCSLQGVRLFGYHTSANRIERTAPSEASKHICWDCARNLAIAFFCPFPEDYRMGDAVMPRRYGQ
jgi:hypothetical protein